LHTELQDGRTFVLNPVKAIKSPTSPNRNRSSTKVGAKLFIVD